MVAARLFGCRPVLMVAARRCADETARDSHRRLRANPRQCEGPAQEELGAVAGVVGRAE